MSARKSPEQEQKKTDPQEVARDLARQYDSLLLSINNPAVAASKLAEYAQKNYPSRVTSAMWISITKDELQDQGFDFTVYRLPWWKRRISFGALLGAKSAGLRVDYDLGKVGPSNLAIGIGAVAPYADPGKLEPVFTARISI